MKILITGGSGFIGSAVVKELEKRNMIAIPYDRINGCDIQNEEMVQHAVKICDGVIHLAGILGTNELFERPQQAVDINIKGALNIILACAKHGVQYSAIQMPNTAWNNIYQATKYCAYNLANAYRIYQNMPCSFVRAFNAYGKGQHVYGVQKIIPTFATRAWRGQNLPIWGNGKQLVDMVYVDDIARMLVDALQFHQGQTFDAGTGVGHTVNEIAEAVLTTVSIHGGTKSRLQYFPMRKGELETGGVAPVAKGEGWDLLGYRPRFRFLEFVETVDWYREDRP